MSRRTVRRPRRVKSATDDALAKQLVERIDSMRSAWADARPTTQDDSLRQPRIPAAFAEHAAAIEQLTAALPVEDAAALTAVVADALTQALNQPRHEGILGRWLSMQEERGYSGHHPGTDVPFYAAGLPNGSAAAAARIAALHRGERLLRDIMNAVVCIADAEVGDATNAIAFVDKIGRAVKTKGPDPEIVSLVEYVKRASAQYFGEYFGNRGQAVPIPLTDAARWMRSGFEATWPDLPPLDQALVEAAIVAWPTRKKWVAIRVLAQSAGLSPPHDLSAAWSQIVARRKQR